MRSNYKKIGKFVRQVSTRNTGLSTTDLKGISINKEFMQSVANVNGTDLSKYRVVHKTQFAFNPMHVGRDEVLPISMLESSEKVIVSPAYVVFEIIDKNELDPEYLMMWCRRPEFDRNAWFTTDNSVRGGFSWDDFCDMELPVPSIEKQREIVKEYNVIVNRINLNEQLNQKLEETAQAIYKQWFVDFEFPDKEGKPYKSSGGEMVYNGELQQEIPKNWAKGQLGDVIELQRGYDLPSQNRQNGPFPIYAASGFSEFHSEYKVKAPGIVTGRSGSIGDVFYVSKDFWPLNTTLWVKAFKHSTPTYAYFVLKSINLLDYNGGSAVPTLNRNHVYLHDMCIPEMQVINKFEHYAQVLFKYKNYLDLQLEKILEFRDILLSRMASKQLEAVS